MSKHVVRNKQRGQAIVIIAGALVAILALVALAVDGANAFAQRRIAQNAVDGATNAGVTAMNTVFLSHRYIDNSGQPRVRPITGAEDQTVIAEAIKETLRANGAADELFAPGSSTKAYYLSKDGTQYGAVGLGRTVPFADGSAPGSPGVAGIWVQSTVQSGTYFARIIGINSVGSDAHSSAAISGISCNGSCGVGDTKGEKIIPFTIFTPIQPNLVGDIEVSGYNQRVVPGSWGMSCFHSSNAARVDCSTYPDPWAVINDWLQNGFNPANPGAPSGGLRFATEQASANLNQGPYQVKTVSYYPFGNDSDPAHTSSTGVWGGPSPAATLDPRTAALVTQAIQAHQTVFVPVANKDWADTQGNHLTYHVIGLARVQFLSGSVNGTITVRVLGWNWDPSSVQAKSSDLYRSGVVFGQTVLRLGP